MLKTSSMGAAPRVMYCVGATKAGTGWLYEYLRDHPECYFRSIKELHYFDALENGKLDREIAKHQNRRAAFQRKVSHSRGEQMVDHALALRDRTEWLSVLARGEDTAAYLDYLCAGREAEQVVGDITPAYCLLPGTRLRMMADLAPDVRFIYLLRDPVERVWSHIRMMAAWREPSGEATPDRAARILRRTLMGEESQIARRSDYAGNLTRLKRVVGDRLKVVFFEDLFNGGGLGQICDHLGISHLPPDRDKIVHAGHALELLPEQRLALRDWLAPQYAYVSGAMGQVPEAWQ